MHRTYAPVATFLLLALFVPSLAISGDRIPGEKWMQFLDPGDAGFDAEKLEAAKETWRELPSSAFLVIADGAVVAAWGDVERRFMCHSVRKSFLSGLYGIYWDRGEIDLNKNLADLGIDDEPDRLLETEKRARILDLLKASSGVFHPAAYAGRTDSRPRGSEGPGRYFAYNNWDFNTLAAILEQETGDRVFESFDEHFAHPLGMEDWRVSDGYYHFELDKSKYPAYPFRMSARDAARYGLLFAREGLWDETRILSRHWVRRSSALYSIDDDIRGYGFMWWIFREPRFERYGMYAALGVGNQMIAVLPDIDVVIVNRANTYEGERTPSNALQDLVAQILDARTSGPVEDAKLVALNSQAPSSNATRVEAELLEEFVGTWAFPPNALGLSEQFQVDIRALDGHLEMSSPVAGTFDLYLRPDETLMQADSHRHFFPVRGDDGDLQGLSNARNLVIAAVTAAAEGEKERSLEILDFAVHDDDIELQVGRQIVSAVLGETEDAIAKLAKLAEESDAREVEAGLNGHGYGLLGDGHLDMARELFEINVELFPGSSNAWDSLGEAEMLLGEHEKARHAYRKSLELDESNSNAESMIARLERGNEEFRAGGIPALMEKARIPGLTLAVIEDGETTRTQYLGVSDAEIGNAITAETLFEAASLSKPVFATVVLRLAERGEIDLDQSLFELLPYERLSEDQRYQALTPRIVLSHRTGLPNWGGEKLELDVYPGTRYGYSGEGYVYLQKAVEKITGMTLDELARREVFEPLGMHHSLFSWSEENTPVLARPHDRAGEAGDKNVFDEGNAAASLHTTAADYARFVIAWMGDDLLTTPTIRQALAPAVGMAWQPTSLEKPKEVSERIAWGLGWGLQVPAAGQENDPIVWHWGDNGAFKAFVAFRPRSRSGLVYFANSTNGLAIGETVVGEIVGDVGPIFKWLGYDTHDQPGFVELLAGITAENAGHYQQAIGAFEAALRVDSDQDETRRRVEWLKELIAATQQPITLAESLLENYSGNYGPRRLVLRDGTLFYQREGRSEYRLIPMSENLFALETMPTFRLEVETDEEGRSQGLVGHYVNGFRDETPRDSAPQD